MVKTEIFQIERHSGHSHVNGTSMKCATNVYIMLAFCMATTLLRRFSDTAYESVHNESTFFLDVPTNAAALATIPTEEIKLEYEIINKSEYETLCVSRIDVEALSFITF